MDRSSDTTPKSLELDLMKLVIGGLPGHTALVLLVATSLTLSCAPGPAVRPDAVDAPVYQVVTPPVLRPGAAISAPRNEAVLTISGNIATSNAGATLSFDLATLEQLGIAQYTVMDPFEKHTIAYAGVLLSDLLKYAGTRSTAKSIHLVALDDYESEITMEDINKWPILIATRIDGGAIAIKNGGPTRVVFPIHAYQIDAAYNDQWVWSIKSIDVR
jgi:hypothetical protein